MIEKLILYFVFPRMSTSPFLISETVIFSPFNIVPFVEPISSTITFPSEYVRRQCSPETALSDITTLFVLRRPRVALSENSTILTSSLFIPPRVRRTFSSGSPGSSDSCSVPSVSALSGSDSSPRISSLPISASPLSALMKSETSSPSVVSESFESSKLSELSESADSLSVSALSASTGSSSSCAISASMTSECFNSFLRSVKSS